VIIPVHPRTLVATVLATATAVLLSACGGSSAVSASAVASCAHAQQQTSSALPNGAPTFRAVVAQTVKDGWLRQNTNLTNAVAGTPTYEIYVFATDQLAEAAFNMIANDSSAREEYGDGGTFRRRNIIINTDQGEAGPLTAHAETLLNKCAGAGASQSITRAGEAVVDGQTSSERQRSEENGAAPNTGETVPRTSGDTTSTISEPAQEPPASENVPNPGQSPAPAREGE
jgi:hypothetical protein